MLTFIRIMFISPGLRQVLLNKVSWDFGVCPLAGYE